MFGLGIAKKIGLSKVVDSYYQYRAKRLFKLKLSNDKKKVAQRAKQKIFIIGLNKTGTTSLESALREFDIIVGHQRTAEKLLDKMLAEKYKALFSYCQTAEAFQDFPFSVPKVYKLLDKHFTNSKFILSVRDNESQWYDSVSKFHSKLWGKNGQNPTREELEDAIYIYKGYLLKGFEYLHGTSTYDKEILCDVYINHNEDVIKYFKGRDNLLVLNVSKPSSYKEFCTFIGQEPLRDSFEWKNRTSEIEIKN